ncbi:MAG: hypothetical protein IJ604_11455 [Prevotella sp.]|nr:hypothetical protein [Prevotella sp.]
MNRKRVKITIAVALAMLSPKVVQAQDIIQIAKSDPLIITGAIGTQNTYYHSSVGDGYASPLSNMFYANLNISVYGFSMPFSLIYTNDNLDFNYPHISFNLTPKYKNWTGYIGKSAMPFSQYVMGVSFNGVGLEYNDKTFRAGAFYGKFNSAINDDPYNPGARAPQYRRMGWGFKVGYGSARNYIDLYLLRAYDVMGSLNETWRDQLNAQENLVLGVKGCVSLKDWLSLTANVATSAITTDRNADLIESGKATQYDDIFKARYSSLVRFAGDVSANLTLPNFNTSVVYRLVQPDYTSLGIYHMSNNYHSLGLNMSTYLFKKVSLAGNFSFQEDNLTNEQLYTTRGFVYGANAGTRLGEHFNLSVGYNGYLQTQDNGTAIVNDTTRVKRAMNSFTVVPSYAVETDNFSHGISFSAAYTENKDLNKFSYGMSDVTSVALGASYALGVNDWATDFALSLSHQLSKGYDTKYTSDVASLTAGRSFLKDDALSVEATLSLCYNEVEYQSKSLSLGGEIAVGYTLKDVHAFSLSAGVNKYGDVNVTKTRSSLDATDITASFTYTYTFSIFEMKNPKGGANKKM